MSLKTDFEESFYGELLEMLLHHNLVEYYILYVISHTISISKQKKNNNTKKKV